MATAVLTNPTGVAPAEKQYVRFTLGQRYLHAVLMVTFLALALTGLPLRFSASHWSTDFSALVGGFGVILYFHKLAAVALTIAFAIHVSNILYRVIAKREYTLVWGPTTLIPQLKDIFDFIGHFKWFLHLGPRPKFGRYAYWDKVDYWAVFWGMGIIGFSGYAMWFAPTFGRLIPGWWMNIALLVHGEEALLAVSFIFTIHFFNTHLRHGSFPMDMGIFTGRISEAELEDRHPEELEMRKQSGELAKLEAPTPETWLTNFAHVVGYTAVAMGFVMLVFTVGAFIQDLMRK